MRPLAREFREIVAERGKRVAVRGAQPSASMTAGWISAGGEGITGCDVCEANECMHQGELPEGDRALRPGMRFPVEVIVGSASFSQLAAIDEGFQDIFAER